MAKAALTLPNGTTVNIEGTPEEVRTMLEFYSSVSSDAAAPRKPKTKKKSKSARAPTKTKTGAGAMGAAPDLAQIVNLVKTCDEAEDIEKHVLDRTSQVDRTLLSLYIVHEHLNNNIGLTSGDVAKITRDLGVPVAQPAASRTLSGTAAKYVIGDTVRVKGQTVRYKLSRRGVQYMKNVISGASNGDAS
jgi:hypothetical protein